jgi:hypothetical protein
VSRLCKFQLAFIGDIPELALRALPSVSLDIQGRFVRIIMEGDRNECAAKLNALSPAVIDEMPMNFEEAFIHEVDRKEARDEVIQAISLSQNKSHLGSDRRALPFRYYHYGYNRKGIPLHLLGNGL